MQDAWYSQFDDRKPQERMKNGTTLGCVVEEMNPEWDDLFSLVCLAPAFAGAQGD
jgi:hypothetical protein